MSDHLSVEELAEAAEDLLDRARADAVRTHLGRCPVCRETAELLASVSGTLAGQPAPPMPPEVIRRLEAVVADEQARRATPPDVPADDVPTHAEILTWTPRKHLDPPRPLRTHRGHSAGWILAAAALATMVGFGGYVISARAGLNEPPNGVAALNSSDLRKQAGALESSRDVDPHRFSRAWSCAREATDGRITGLASVTVDGSPALLVYLSTAAGQQVSVVEGCDDGAPRVTDTTPLTR